jgi:hypothetical protein
MNETLLLFATYGLHLMGEPHETPEKALIAWFMLHEPGLFEHSVFTQPLQIEGIESFRNANLNQFFEMAIISFTTAESISSA